jgi:lipoate-protein ligase A
MGELLDTPDILELFGEPAECRTDGACEPAENMRQEWERVLACARSPSVPPLLRFYWWRPWALSLGVHQREDIVDSERCRQHRIVVVRRPTGGRAVLHAEEVTYAVIVRLSAQRTPQLLYRLIHERIAAALQRFTPTPLVLTPAGITFRHIAPRTLAAACFNSAARWELTAAGRKLVGSAQRIVEGVLLQHGSILLGNAHVLLAELLRFPSETEREHFRRELERRSVSLEQLAATEVGYDAVVAALWETFCGVPLRAGAQETTSASGSGSNSA